MKILYLFLVAAAFTVLLITLYPFRQKYSYPNALPTPTPTQPITPTDVEWQTYRNDQYGFEFQYPDGEGFDPNYTVDQTNLSYSEMIKKMEPIKSSETTISINNTKYNLFKAQFGDIGEFSFVYFSYLKHNYIITFGEFSIDTITRILSSFKFFTPSKYTCPTAQWVDCMPGPGVQKPQCDSAYLTWAKANCPNFKGAAL